MRFKQWRVLEGRILLTQSRLKEVLSYDKITGEFHWKLARGCRAAGSRAGFDTGRGYLKARVDETEYYLHRLAWLYAHGQFPPKDIDHINGDRTDNRMCNLRAVSRQENHKNRGVVKANKSGRIGVFWNTQRKKWTARIKVWGVSHNLGDFDDVESASRARTEAEQKFGFHVNHGNRVAFHAP